MNKNYENHDFCESCYETWKDGKVNAFTDRINPVSKRPEDHVWEIRVNPKEFKSSVKSAGATQPKAAKLKPNDPCPGGCGKKVKKCACPK